MKPIEVRPCFTTAKIPCENDGQAIDWKDAMAPADRNGMFVPPGYAGVCLALLATQIATVKGLIASAPQQPPQKTISLHLDKSSPGHLCFECDGKPIGMQEAFERGFQVRSDDTPAMLTLAKKFVEGRDEGAM